MMVVARLLDRPRRVGACVAGVLLGAFAAAPAAADLLDPTPLILKDGRIASVSVHTLPFAAGERSLDQQTGSELRGLTVAMATDCFLTAQVIGHVGSDEVEANDTLGAHRLARARADAVQASLIDSGLPAKSIASVWDWQFMVLEPRATLWVFRLTEGEDCEGKPLEGVDGPLLAAAEEDQGSGTGRATAGAPAATARPAAAATTPAPAVTTARPAMARAATPAASESPATTAAARATAAPKREAAASPAASATTTKTPRATITASPPHAADPVERAAAPTRTLPATPAAAAPVQAAPVREVATRSSATPLDGDAASLAIVFATNSSYFPAGTRNRLAALVEELEGGGRYQVDLLASVSDATSVVGASSPAEAARYNKWLADRRLERVRDWLEANAGGKDLIIRPDYRDGDDSRRVEVRIAPAKTS